MLKNIRSKEKLINLKYYDIFILTIILFGAAIFSSTGTYLDMVNGVPDVSIDEALNFSEMDNWRSFFTQSIYLLIAIGYLFLRNFDFKRFHVKFTAKSIFLAVLYFIVSALIMDLFFMLTNSANLGAEPLTSSSIFSDISFSLIIYTILNGFYEEFFFLGICMAVDKKHRLWVLLYS